MKKILLFVSLLLLGLACAAPPTNESLTTNRNTNAAEPVAAAMTESAAIAQEREVWDMIKNKNYDAFAAKLANEQVEVGGEGIFDRTGTIASVKDFEPSELTFSDWKFLSIDKDAYVVTYTVAVKGKYRGQEMKPETVRASSAWVSRSGKWLAIYHQSSPVMTAPASPSPSPSRSPSASPATSPAASASPLTLTDDPIANERAIWEALKTKNYDAFESALAADSIEVEPNGVFPKGETMRLIRGFDFSRAEVSEFRAVPFDADAKLVVYKVKPPGTNPVEYHSTIWANRDGKWAAIFHQGTPSIPIPPPSSAATKAPVTGASPK